MKPALIVAGVVGAAALFVGAVGVLPAEQRASVSARQPVLQALNPQPLPPRYYIPVNPGDPWLSQFQPSNSADELNPQPLPPRWSQPLQPLLQGVAVTLNPQLLPPGFAGHGDPTGAVFPS